MPQPSKKANQLLAANLLEQLEGATGRQIGSQLGFHVVRLLRKLVQSSEGYQAWLLQQQNRVIQSFVAQCKQESAQTELFKSTNVGAASLEEAELHPRSIEMLRQQKPGNSRPRIPSAEQLQEWLSINAKHIHHVKTKPSLWQRIIRWCNPFDDEETNSKDYFTAIRNSGLALRSELMSLIEGYYLICKEADGANSADYILEQGLVLVDYIAKMNRLVASAEDMVLRGKALQAGFDLSVLLKVSQGLRNERAMIAYLVAHPESLQGVHSWDHAIEELRGSK
jgi:hypothetical protein